MLYIKIYFITHTHTHNIYTHIHTYIYIHIHTRTNIYIYIHGLTGWVELKIFNATHKKSNGLSGLVPTPNKSIVVVNSGIIYQ